VSRGFITKERQVFGGESLFIRYPTKLKKKENNTSLLEEGSSYTHPVKHPMSFDPTAMFFPMEEHNFLPDGEVKSRSLAAAMLSNAGQWWRRKQEGVDNKNKQNTPECRKIISSFFVVSCPRRRIWLEAKLSQR
jgi:hypothetical protein